MTLLSIFGVCIGVLDTAVLLHKKSSCTGISESWLLKILLLTADVCFFEYLCPLVPNGRLKKISKFSLV